MKRLIFSLMLFAGMYSLSSCEKANDSTNGVGNDNEMIDLMDHFYQREWEMTRIIRDESNVYEDTYNIFFAERDTAFIAILPSDVWKPIGYEIDGIKLQFFGKAELNFKHPFYLVSHEDGEYVLSAKYTDVVYDAELILREKEITRSTEE